MRMTDLLSKEEWKELEDELNKKWGVNACAYDAEGFSFTGFKNFSNPLCPSIKDGPGGLQAICSVAHQFMAKEARESGMTVADECDAGLVKICAPVIVEGEFVGILGVCGCLGEEGEVETFIVEKAADIDPERAGELATGVPVLSGEKAAELARHLEERVAGIIARRG